MIKSITTSVRRVERFFGPDDQWVENFRQTSWRAAQKLLGDKHTFVRDKNRADYEYTAHVSPQRVAEALYAEGYQRNILSTVKTRNGTDFVHSAWVLDTEDTEWQQDVFIWENADGTTDVYSHKEPSVRRPKAHLNLSTGVNGDPDGRVRDVLETHGIEYST